jgi:hypothetical protein
MLKAAKLMRTWNAMRVFSGKTLTAPDFLGRSEQGIKGGDHLRIATREMIREPDVAAEMKLVSTSEGAPAFRARPQRLHWAQLTISRS